MINTGSYHVYPGEIEEVLTSHPAVRAVSVIGVPDVRWGEAVKVCVVVTEGYTGDSELERDLIAHCKAHLPGYKAPKSVDFLDKNELSAEGTLNRERLRSRYALRGVATRHNTSR